MKYKTIFAAALVAAGLSGGAYAQEITLRYAFQNPANHPTAQAAQKFADVLARKTGGAVSVELYAGGQLGGVKDVIQNLQLGAIDMTLARPGHVADLGADAFNVLSLPYIFTDQDHERRVLESPVGEKLLSGLGDIKLVGIGFYIDSPRHFFFVDTPVKAVKDMKGLKIRSQTSELAVDTIKAFGASPTPMAFSELYGALQSGVVDGADQPLSGFYAQKYQEVAKYIVLDGHDASPVIILMSKKAWNSLSKDQQQAVREAHQAAADFYFKIDAVANARIRGELEAAGVTIVDVKDKTPWQAAVKSVNEEYGAKNKDLVDAIRALQ